MNLMLLLVLGVVEGAPALSQTAEAEVAAAIAKTRNADRYAFKIETKLLSGPSAQSAVAEGRYQKDQPTWMKSGEVEVYRKGESLVMLRQEKWRRVEGRDADRRRVRGAFTADALRALRLPHEELAGIEKRFSAVRKLDAKEGDQDVYLGELTEQAAKEILDANSERKLEGAPSGTGRFWITPAGEIAMVEIIVQAKGKERRDTGFSAWITLSEVGTAKIEVPEGAAKALEEK